MAWGTRALEAGRGYGLGVRSIMRTVPSRLFQKKADALLAKIERLPTQTALLVAEAREARRAAK